MVDFKIVGTLDFLPKMGFVSFSSEVGDRPAFMWWHTYLVKSTTNQITPLRDNKTFCVVDNLDAEGQWFIVKDLAPVTGTPNELFTLINHGYTPSITSTAEVTPAKSGAYLYIGLPAKRADTVAKIEELLKTCDEVYPVMSMYPTLQVCDYMYKI